MITVERFLELARQELPFAVTCGFTVESLDDGVAVARSPYQDTFLRPGGTIAGPIMMGLADYAMYGAVLSKIGEVALAVTTNLNINFLRRPPPGDLLARARLLKLGQRLAVGDVDLWIDGRDGLVAHATATYSIPPTS